MWRFQCTRTGSCKVSGTNRFCILVQLQARQAQLKRRLAVIRGGGGARWRMEALHLPALKETRTHFSKVPQGKGKGGLGVLCFHWSAVFPMSWGICSVLLSNPENRCIAVLPCNQKVCPPLLVDSHTSVTRKQQTRLRGNFSGSLTRGRLLLRAEFS